MSKNLLMVDRARETVSYNPALFQKQTGQSTVYAPRKGIDPTRPNPVHQGPTRSAVPRGSFRHRPESRARRQRQDQVRLWRRCPSGPRPAKHIDYGYSVHCGKPPASLAPQIHCRSTSSPADVISCVNIPMAEVASQPTSATKVVFRSRQSARTIHEECRRAVITSFEGMRQAASNSLSATLACWLHRAFMRGHTDPCRKSG